MKPIIIMLFERGFDPAKVAELTGFPIHVIRYAKKKYEADKPLLEELLNRKVAA